MPGVGNAVSPCFFVFLEVEYERSSLNPLYNFIEEIFCFLVCLVYEMHSLLVMLGATLA